MDFRRDGIARHLWPPAAVETLEPKSMPRTLYCHTWIVCACLVPGAPKTNLKIEHVAASSVNLKLNLTLTLALSPTGLRAVERAPACGVTNPSIATSKWSTRICETQRLGLRDKLFRPWLGVFPVLWEAEHVPYVKRQGAHRNEKAVATTRNPHGVDV